MKFDFLKNFTGEGNNKKRQIENIVVFIIILIITVIIINNMWTSDNNADDEKNSTKVLATTNEVDTVQGDDLESRLEDILESINGVGKTKVLIKYSESSSIVAMYNETSSESKTQESDSGGGTKNVTETESKKEVVYDESNEPVTKKIVMPKVEGAIVTAKGAGNANVKSAIVSAVEAITGLAVHKIQVFEMKD